jgi:iron complex transport system substrate-binding protein
MAVLRFPRRRFTLRCVRLAVPLITLGSVLGGLSACTSPDREATKSSTAENGIPAVARAVAPETDDYGDTIVFGAAPTRVVSLNPTTTETIFAMGLNRHLIGRSHWDAWPDSALQLPDLGNALRPNVEAILAARPDLVILYASADNRPATLRLRAAGIHTLAFRIDRVTTFDHVTRILGRVLGDSASGARVADSVGATLARVRAATASLRRPTVVWPFAYRPAMVVGGGSYMTELLEIAGARNLYGDLRDPSPIVTIEDVVQKNPDFIIRSVDRTQTVTQPSKIESAWQAVPAVRENRILISDAGLVARPSVRLGEAAMSLARLLHPGITIQ